MLILLFSLIANQKLIQLYIFELLKLNQFYSHGKPDDRICFLLNFSNTATDSVDCYFTKTTYNLYFILLFKLLFFSRFQSMNK